MEMHHQGRPRVLGPAQSLKERGQTFQASAGQAALPEVEQEIFRQLGVHVGHSSEPPRPLPLRRARSLPIPSSPMFQVPCWMRFSVRTIWNGIRNLLNAKYGRVEPSRNDEVVKAQGLIPEFLQWIAMELKRFLFSQRPAGNSKRFQKC